MGNGGYATTHEGTVYHQKATAKAMAFIEAMEHPERSIDQALDKQLKESIEKNRQALVPIVKTIVLAGRLGLALRGHRDDGSLIVSIQTFFGAPPPRK